MAFGVMVTTHMVYTGGILIFTYYLMMSTRPSISYMCINILDILLFEGKSELFTLSNSTNPCNCSRPYINILVVTTTQPSSLRKLEPQPRQHAYVTRG